MSIKKEIIKISKTELQLNSRKFTTSEIGRGIGYQPIKKGKGSYNRKPKYKKNYSDNLFE